MIRKLATDLVVSKTLSLYVIAIKTLPKERVFVFIQRLFFLFILSEQWFTIVSL